MRETNGKRVTYATALVLAAAVGAAVGLGLATYACDSPAGPTEPTTAAPAVPAGPTRYKMPVTSTQPSLGPGNALVTVVEWCDLRGPTCRRANATMHVLLARYAGKLRWVHRGLLDTERPEESWQAHRLARAAFQHSGKFWELRDALLALPDDAMLDEATLRSASSAAGVDYEMASKAAASGSLDPALQVDRMFAKKFGVSAPLAYFVNGMSVPLLPGRPIEATLTAAIETEFAHADELVHSGVAADRVYDEIIKDGAWQAPTASLGPR